MGGVETKNPSGYKKAKTQPRNIPTAIAAAILDRRMDWLVSFLINALSLRLIISLPD